MKGKISLNEFIRSVKKDIMSSLDSESPFFEITKVQLEASFAVSFEGEAGFSLYVVDASTTSSATQTHKVVIDLTPLGSGNGINGSSGSSSVVVTRTSGKKISVKPIRGPVAKRIAGNNVPKTKAAKKAVAKLKKAARKKGTKPSSGKSKAMSDRA